jgi:predicted SAM-dependent methyltransferase
MTNQKLYVQFGAGNEAIPGWVSFDSSPTLVIQKIPVVGRVLRPMLNCVFDGGVRYGDIVRGLPLRENSVDGLFSSHVIEHLSYLDCSTALKNSFTYLKPRGLFRIIIPDLEWYVRRYLAAKEHADSMNAADAAPEFMKGTCLGLRGTRRDIWNRLYLAFSNSDHRWMWDYAGLSNALAEHGFVDVKRFDQGNCEDGMFLRPERDHQFGAGDSRYGLSVECRKPS